MEEVRLGYRTGAMLTLSDPKRGDDGELWSIVATLELEGLRATKEVSVHYATGMDELIAYLDDLAQHWQGWDSVKDYQSLEGDLTLKARHDGTGHVVLDVELNRNHPPNEWSVRGQVVTDPGAQMADAAAASHVVLARLP
jgi:hypothetical protein